MSKSGQAKSSGKITTATAELLDFRLWGLTSNEKARGKGMFRELYRGDGLRYAGWYKTGFAGCAKGPKVASRRHAARLGRTIEPRWPPVRLWAAVRGVRAADALAGSLPDGQNPVFDDEDETPALAAPVLPFAALAPQIRRFNAWALRARASNQPVAILDFYRYLDFIQHNSGEPPTWSSLRPLEAFFFLPGGWGRVWHPDTGKYYYYDLDDKSTQWDRPR